MIKLLKIVPFRRTFQLEYLQLAQSFSWTSFRWLRICIFRLQLLLLLGQTLPVSVEIVIIGSNMHASLEIVAICSDYVHFSCNTLSWLKLCTFQPGKLRFSWNARVAIEMVGVCLDCKWLSWNRSNWPRIWVSDEIVTFGSGFVLFSWKNSIGQKLCTLPSEKLNLAWNIYALFEMVGVCLDYAWFSWNSWTGLWIFVEYWKWINIGQEESLQLKFK